MRDPLIPSSKNTDSFKLVAFDVAAGYAAPGIALWMRDLWAPMNVSLTSIAVYTVAGTCFSAICFVLFRVANCLPRYFSLRDAVEIAKASTCAVTATAAFLFTLTRLEEIPRSIPAIHFLVLTTILIVGRLIRCLASQCADLGAETEVPQGSERNVIIVGAGRLASFYVRLLDSLVISNWRIAGILDDDPRLHGHSMFGHFIIGGTNEAAALLDDFAQHGIDISGFVICESDRDRARELRDRLKPLCVQRGLHTELLIEQLGISGDGSEERTRNSLGMFNTNPNIVYIHAKRIIEPVIAALAIAALSPIFALISLLVLIGMGSPILFWQRRIGQGGRPIYIYKFKTMRNPVDRMGRVRTQSERVSLIGLFLRATRLDELPQLYNVARGDMAIIGPRPLLPIDQPTGATSRLDVLPGLTGWAQIHGGKLVSVEEKNELDEWYVRNAGLQVDLEIILRTVTIVLAGDRRQRKWAAARKKRSGAYGAPQGAADVRQPAGHGDGVNRWAR